MSTFRWVTPDFAVAPQLEAADFGRAAEAGFRTLINNRPEGEAPGQMSADAVRQAAQEAGLALHEYPFAGPPPRQVVEATAQILAQAERPVLAFCRSGTRSVTAWAFAEALAGKRKTDEIIALAAGAGYDLSGARGALDQLGGG